MNSLKKPMIILTGPTAVGKSALSINLAKSIDGEIISADSMQVYRGMDIGSAKITENQMQGIHHYMIDILDPEEPFDVFTFLKEAKAATEEIYQHGKIPIVTGGTGFYIQALLYDIDFNDEDIQNSVFRNECERFVAENGVFALHDRLREIDPESARIIHPNNVKRVIRALEFYENNHSPISKHNEEQRNKDSQYNFCYFVLNEDRNRVYEKIDERVDIMIQEGLEDEVKRLMNSGLTRDYVSMQGLGYKEIYDYLTGEISKDRAIYEIKRDTRHFAKRQLTWFRRERDVIWINKEEFHNDHDEMVNFMKNEMLKRGIVIHE